MIDKRLYLRLERWKPAILAASVLAGAVDAAAETSRRPAERGDAAPSTLTGAAVMAIVSLDRQRVTLYDARGNTMRARVSSGQTEYETPVGIYSVLQKKEEHYSNLYDAAMPFMQRITWSGIALHAGALPGYPASHGCVRLPHSFAERIFGTTRLGMRVIVARDDVAPAAIAHPLLFQPRPLDSESGLAAPAAYRPESATEDTGSLLPDVSNWPARQRQLEELKVTAAEKLAVARAASDKAEPFKAQVKHWSSELKKASKTLRAAEANKRIAEERAVRAERSLATTSTPKVSKAAGKAKAKAVEMLSKAEAQIAAATGPVQVATDALARASELAKAAEAEELAAGAAAKEARNRMMPVSVFISLQSQRLYVRQGFVPVLESPVTIRDPERPIGTHVYSALDYADGGNSIRWNVVSLAKRSLDGEMQWEAVGSKNDDDSGAITTELSAANEALDRVTIPAEVLARFNEFVWPGSSLIISDEELHKETGNATDFVVLISGEPQGGIKKRPRQLPDEFLYGYGGYDPYYSYSRPPRYERYFSYGRPRKNRQRYGAPTFGWW